MAENDGPGSRPEPVHRAGTAGTGSWSRPALGSTGALGTSSSPWRGWLRFGQVACRMLAADRLSAGIGLVPPSPAASGFTTRDRPHKGHMTAHTIGGWPGRPVLAR